MMKPLVETLHWHDNSSVEAALSVARALDKPVLADFWSPTCLGCAKLFKTTYSEPSVQDYLARHYVLVKYNTKTPNEWFKRLNGSFGHFWHPNLVVLDHRLTEMYRAIGYLPPEDFILSMEIGRGLHEMYHGRSAAALTILQGGAETWQASPLAPEALYWAGVAAYRVSGRLEPLSEIWAHLGSRYGGSTWAHRADCLDVSVPAGGFDPTDAGSVTLRTPAG